jgi:hypothetical protein
LDVAAQVVGEGFVLRSLVLLLPLNVISAGKFRRLYDMALVFLSTQKSKSSKRENGN